MTIAKRRILPVFIALLLIVTNFAATYDAYANPIIYPIAEGAMYLTGTLLAAFGISLGDDTETESIRETKLATYANILGKRIKAEWSEPDNILYRALINAALPGAVLDLTPDQYDLFMRMGKTAYNEFTAAPNNTVSCNTYPSSLEPGYYLYQNAETDPFNKYNYPTLTQYEVLDFNTSTVYVTDYMYDTGDKKETYTFTVTKDASYGIRYWVNGRDSYTYNVPSTVVGWCLKSEPQYNSYRGYQTLLYAYLVLKDASGNLSYGNHLKSWNQVCDIQISSVPVTAHLDTSVVVGDTYSLPDTDGKKKVAIPQALSDFGSTVKTVSDVIPASQTVPTDPPADSKINWEPLKVTGTLFTTKFPFSLPWDILRTFQALLIDDPKMPKWDIKWHDQILHKDFGFTIDLTSYDRIFKIARNFILVALNVGLIMATRKLVGGAT